MDKHKFHFRYSQKTDSVEQDFIEMLQELNIPSTPLLSKTNQEKRLMLENYNKTKKNSIFYQILDKVGYSDSSKNLLMELPLTKKEGIIDKFHDLADPKVDAGHIHSVSVDTISVASLSVDNFSVDNLDNLNVEEIDQLLGEILVLFINNRIA